MQDERRRVYRNQPKSSVLLQARTKSPSGETSPWYDALDVSIRGISFLIGKKDATLLSVGQQVLLQVRTANMDPVDVVARLVSRVEEMGSQRYGFEFDEWEQLSRQELSQFYRLFNRRRAPRINLDPRNPIGIQFETEAKSEDSEIGTGILLDLSTHGLAVLVNPDVEEKLSNAETVAISFTLPGINRVFRLSAQIRNRRLIKQSISYGMEIDPVETPNYIEQQNDLRNFVKQNQIE